MRPKKMTAKQIASFMGLNKQEQKKLKLDMHIFVESWNQFIRQEVFELRRCWKGEWRAK